jgi:hypothetical protein
LCALPSNSNLQATNPKENTLRCTIEKPVEVDLSIPKKYYLCESSPDSCKQIQVSS